MKHIFEYYLNENNAISTFCGKFRNLLQTSVDVWCNLAPGHTTTINIRRSAVTYFNSTQKQMNRHSQTTQHFIVVESLPLVEQRRMNLCELLCIFVSYIELQVFITVLVPQSLYLYKTVLKFLQLAISRMKNLSQMKCFICSQLLIFYILIQIYIAKNKNTATVDKIQYTHFQRLTS